MEVESMSCRQELLQLLSIHSNPQSNHDIYIMYTDSIHDTYRVVYTETTNDKDAIHVYTQYSPQIIPGGKLIYYMDYDRRNVNHALHMISTDEFEITYGSCWVVFTKTFGSSSHIPTFLHIDQ